ncbi:MAG: phosphoribosylglycinamide formyltransferase [Candidatus Fermentibacteraceae bacterium]
MTGVPIGVLASGRGSNFAALVRGDTVPGFVRVLLADDPEAPALALARDLGVEGKYLYAGPRRTSFDPARENEWAQFLLARGVELVCLAGLMRVLKGPLLDAFPGRVLNIHPSLLPSFPGLDAQGQAVRHGVKVSGCTVHYVDRGVDTGPILLQTPVRVKPSDDREALAERILRAEHLLYPKAVKLHLEREGATR